MRPVTAGLALVAVVAHSAQAQCPDGSRPPCATQAGARRLPPLDANRVAVLPFRVASADSMLGEGFAELLAPEFTGEGSPRATDMASTLRAWRRAGGGLRSPLAESEARNVARELGAGLLVQGSIVGLGSRMTINASLLDVASGRTRGDPARVAGMSDSIDVLLREMAARLLVAAGAAGPAADVSRLQTSPSALRAYVEGMSLWRRGLWTNAARSLEASIAADTTFAPAIYQRWLVAAMTAGQPEWIPRVVAVKERLSPRDRAVFEANLPATGSRTRAAALADRRATALQLVDSPEAWYFYGDYVFHSGHPVLPVDSIIPIARDAFARAVALDSQPSQLSHLLFVAIHSGDTATIRRLWQSAGRFGEDGRWARAWVTAGMLGDPVLLAQARRQPDPAMTLGSLGNALFDNGVLLSANVVPMPVAVLDEAIQRFWAPAGAGAREMLQLQRAVLQSIRGRPAAAELRQVPSEILFRVWDPFFVYEWWWPTGDAEVDAPLIENRRALPDSIEDRRRLCVTAYLDLSRRNVDRVDPAALGGRANRCRRYIEAWKAHEQGALTDSMLVSLDTLVNLASFTTFVGFEHRLLARIYESRGDTARALRAIQMYPRDFPKAWLPATLREEGRYRLMARDTAGAVRAWLDYLDLRREALPPFTAERDSIQTLVTRLRRR